MTHMGALLFLDEAADLAGVHSRTLLRWVKAGHLLAFSTDERGRTMYLDRDVYEIGRAHV